MALRRVFVVVTTLVVSASLSYAAYWFHAAGQLRKGIEGKADQLRVSGWLVDWSELEVGGFPFRLSARLDGLGLTAPSGFQWQAETLSASASPFDLTRIHATGAGRHRLGIGEWSAAVSAATATADLDFDDSGGLELASAVISDLVVDGGAGIALMAVVIDPLVVIRPGHDVATIGFSATVHDVTLPPLPGLVLGRDVAAADIAGRVMGELPPGSPLDSLVRWSESGGVVEIDRLAVEWDPMSLDASGTVAFDPAMQPLMALSAQLRGLTPLMDRLAQSGVMDVNAAAAAKVMLLLMSKPDSRGRPAIGVPVSVQDGGIFLGPAKVGQMPPLPWPQPYPPQPYPPMNSR